MSREPNPCHHRTILQPCAASHARAPRVCHPTRPASLSRKAWLRSLSHACQLCASRRALQRCQPHSAALDRCPATCALHERALQRRQPSWTTAIISHNWPAVSRCVTLALSTLRPAINARARPLLPAELSANARRVRRTNVNADANADDCSRPRALPSTGYSCTQVIPGEREGRGK